MFEVVFQDGGTANFRWHRVRRSFVTIDEASREAIRLDRMGYPAHVVMQGAPLPTKFARSSELGIHGGVTIATRHDFLHLILRKDIETTISFPNLAKLPEVAYCVDIETGRTIILKRGEKGYYDPGYGVQGQAYVNELNSRIGVSKAQVEAMSFGLMFGFDVPWSDPDKYDKDGRLKKLPK